MKLCMMSCMMGRFTPEQIVATATACGMEAIDWVSTHHTEPAELRKISEDAGLRIAAHTMIKEKFLRRETDYLDEFKASLDDACILGAPVLMLPPFPRIRQVSLEDDRKAWTEYYAQALPLARKAGVTLTLESTGMINSPIVTVSEALEVLRNVPGLKLTLDHGNMQTAEDAVEAYSILKEHVVHVHLKDWKVYDSPRADTTLKRCGKYFANAIIGKGDMDLRTFWENLDSRSRNLYVNLETMDFMNPDSTPDVLKQVSDLLRNW